MTPENSTDASDAPPLDEWRRQVDQRLAALSNEMQTNTAVTSEVRDILVAVRGGMRVLGWLGGIVKWAVPFVAMASALYSLAMQIKGGGK